MIDSPVLYFADRSARAALIVEHNAVLNLCIDWEQLADGLPRVPGLRRWAALRAGFEVFRDDHLPRIERALSEIVQDEPLPSHLMAYVERLAGLVLVDADHSRDVEAALETLLATRDVRQAETAGYMLRCLFEGCRRTILAREILVSAIRLPR